MNTHTVIDGKVCLYSFIDGAKRERVSVCAVIPTHDWDNERLNVLNWKMDAGNNGTATDKVLVTYQTRFDLLAPIFDATWPVVQERFEIKPPTRSKNWTWKAQEEKWFNTKTGEKVYA